jgi:hypothetical protein
LRDAFVSPTPAHATRITFPGPLARAIDSPLGSHPHFARRSAVDLDGETIDTQGPVLVQPLHGPVCDDRSDT